MHAACRTTAAALALLALTGCASLAERNEEYAERRAEREQEQLERQAAERKARIESEREFFETRPRCASEASCDAMWRAAQVWISRNAGMRLQIATDAILETYAPEPSGARLAVRVIREPRDDGESVLTVSTWCGNPFGCMTDPHEAALDFNRTVSAAGG